MEHEDEVVVGDGKGIVVVEAKTEEMVDVVDGNQTVVGGGGGVAN